MKQGDVFGYGQSLSGLVPTGAIADQHGMGAGANLLADLGKVDGHRLAVDPGRDNGSAYSTPPRAAGKTIEVWFQDEARVGQQGTLSYQWAPRGSRAPDRSYEGREVFLKASCAAPSFLG